jgi:glycosyltransferase involved in cell wall biosynthesis
MKIAQIINTLDTGGAEKLTVELTSQLKHSVDKIDIVVLKKSKTIFNTNGLNIIYLGNYSLYNPLYILELIKILKKYDVANGHLFPTLYWLVVAKIISFSKVKLVYTEHNTSNRRRGNLVFKYFDHFIYSFIDHVICITESTKNNISQHLNRTKNISVINNAIDLDKFQGVTIPNYDFFKTDFKIIQISSFRAQKDQMTALKAMKLLPHKIKLILVGDGPLREHHEKFVIDNKLNNRVIFLGNRADIPELLSFSQVVVQSSHYEGFGLTALEGMAANKPVVSSNVNGLNEVVANYGILFKPGDHLDLSKKILKLYKDDDYYDQVQKKCFGRSKDFSIVTMSNNYLKLYKSL